MTECLCLARVAHQQEPESYRWYGNILWAQWRECPTHHERFVAPVWHPQLGQLRDKATAGTVAVKQEA